MSGTRAHRLWLDLGTLLPDARGGADARVRRLVSDLNGHAGIDQAHVLPASGDDPAQLCIHHDPGVVPLAQPREIARSAGARLTERFGHILWDMAGLRDERRAGTERLARLPRVLGDRIGPHRIRPKGDVRGGSASHAG